MILVLVLSACKQAFGLDETQVVPPSDAQYFDAPADAPYACPPAGETPQFSRLFHQIAQSCLYYTSSGPLGRASALCREPVAQVAEGPSEGPLAPVVGLADVGTQRFDLVRLVPEGDELFVRHWDTGTVVGRIRRFRRGGDNAFTSAADVTLQGTTIDSFVQFGAPSRGPRRRMMLRNGPGALQEVEIGETGVAQQIAVYTEAQFGVDVLLSTPNMTADGLRIVFGGQRDGQLTFYSDRATVSDRFSPGRVLEDVPAAFDTFLTEDCSRLYFSALGSILWVPRR